VIQSFADQATADLFYDADTKAARRFPRVLWARIQQKLVVLDSASRLSDLAALPGNRLEPLKGGRAGRYSLRVNDQYRLTFRFDNGHCREVRCEDDH
jgi:proteic killer suppression protein